MSNVNIVVRVLVDGKQKNLSPAVAKAQNLTGIFYIRYRQDGKVKWQSVGRDYSTARIAKLTKERELKGVSPAAANKVTLAEAIEIYLAKVRTVNGFKPYERTKWLLDQFAAFTQAEYLQEITKDHLIAFMTHLKDQGKSPKTLRDRIGSIEVFLQSRGLPKFMKKGDLPKVTKKLVDCYTEDEFNKMLAVADEDERFLLQFLLHTGVRKQEAAHMTWDDVKMDEHKVLVTAKPTCRCPNCGPDGFHIKDFEEREIPDLDDGFVRLLAERKAKSTTNLLFANGVGNPEGGMLFTLKAIGERAGIKCKNCVDVNGKVSCKRHAVTTHKFRRTFATWHNVLGGVSLPVLKQWLGHSDIETTMRYIATTEIRPGLNKENTKKTWTGIKQPAAANVVSIRKSA